MKVADIDSSGGMEGRAGVRRRALVGWIAACAFVVAGPAGAVTLTEAVEQALATHPQIARAEAETRAAGYDVARVRGEYFPSVDLNSGIGAEEMNVKALNLAGADEDVLARREFGLSVRQLVYDGFGTRSEVERRGALLDAAEQNASNVRESVAFDAVQAYLDVALNRELVQLARANVDAHRRTLDNVAAKVRSGVGQKADLQQAEGRLALAQSTLAAREGRLLEVMSSYERVTGQMPADLVTPGRAESGLLVDGRMPDAGLRAAIDTAVNEALNTHPAILRAGAEVEASVKAIDVAKAEYFPRVDVEGNLGRNDNLSGVEGVRNNNTVMVVARWNVFRGGADKAAEQASVERKLAAEQSAEDTRRAVAENVAVAVQARATSESRIAHLERHVTASTDTLQAYKAQFDLGRRTLLDLLNAENELFTARSNLVSGLYEDLVNQYFVEAAKGALVRNLGVNVAQP